MDCSWVWWCTMKPEVQAAWVQAIGSIAAIVAAIGIGWWQWATTRSVLRHSTAGALNFDATFDDDASSAIMKLENVGLGPVRVTRFDVFVDGVLFNEPNLYFTERLCEKLRIDGDSIQFMQVDLDVWIAAGERMTILHWVGIEGELKIGRMGGLLHRLRYEVHCESLAGVPCSTKWP